MPAHAAATAAQLSSGSLGHAIAARPKGGLGAYRRPPALPAWKTSWLWTINAARPLEHIRHADRDLLAPFAAFKPAKLLVYIVWAPPPLNVDFPLSRVS